LLANYNKDVNKLIFQDDDLFAPDKIQTWQQSTKSINEDHHDENPLAINLNGGINDQLLADEVCKLT